MMTRKQGDQLVGQTGLYVPPQVAAPELPPGVDLEKRTSISHLIKVISVHVDLPPEYTVQDDLDKVEPASIEEGLRFSTREAIDKRYKNVYRGIAMTSSDFVAMTLSPSALANRTYSKTKKVNEKRPAEERQDRDEAHETASRAAGHALEGNVAGLEILIGEMAERRLTLLGLNRALRAPGRAFFGNTMGRLDEMRKVASDSIHECIEIAATNLPWDNRTADDLQAALHYNLYGHAGHNNRRIGYWRLYVQMAGRHLRDRIKAAHKSLGLTQEELKLYLPHLLAKEQKEIEEQQNQPTAEQPA